MSESIKMNNIKEIVFKAEKEDKIIISTTEGLIEMDLQEMVDQPAEGILYDLDKDKTFVLSFMEDPKWVNDYAVGQIITKLKALIDNYKEVCKCDKRVKIVYTD